MTEALADSVVNLPGGYWRGPPAAEPFGVAGASPMDAFLHGLEGDQAANGDWLTPGGDPLPLGAVAAPPPKRGNFLQQLFGGG